eukprot:CAMPEP_0119117740 /NCGR_PEP_ID=MMETSP1180-20130426/53006_1 /TAXON_ID=3052 ORGANISM="Chlamydomonas cf sp, Strain CCMP681" /NCGR_SAMPLE_ID=MMETSP1180 /ASSEMBLY_ACC=CAM_ASM_000741 /LENGTH=381 /DNA_ID=CAMNT_0007107033 /DNA_START=1038 /DNA_END=2180 /DNA_ORIENTATION=+
MDDTDRGQNPLSSARKATLPSMSAGLNSLIWNIRPEGAGVSIGARPSRGDANMLSCTYARCGDFMYHQSCLEAFLKSKRLERNRKTGFPCPRGCGKGTTEAQPCPGRITKSHPIIPRNEKKRQVVAELPPKPVKLDKAEKSKAKAEAAKVKALADFKAKEDAVAKVNAVVAAAASAAGSSRAALAAAKPPVASAVEKKQMLAAYKAQALREISKQTGVSFTSSVGAAAGKSSPAPAPASAAWGGSKSGAGSGTESEGPQPATLGQHMGISFSQAKHKVGAASNARGYTASSAGPPEPQLHSFQDFPPVTMSAAPPPSTSSSVWPALPTASTPTPVPVALSVAATNGTGTEGVRPSGLVRGGSAVLSVPLGMPPPPPRAPAG